jgi:hypothetical protein
MFKPRSRRNRLVDLLFPLVGSSAATTAAGLKHEAVYLVEQLSREDLSAFLEIASVAGQYRRRTLQTVESKSECLLLDDNDFVHKNRILRASLDDLSNLFLTLTLTS